MKQFPCVRQLDSADCGAACLATIAQSFGRKVTLARARILASTDRDGTTAFGILRGATAIGLKGEGIELMPVALSVLPLPAIAHLRLKNGDHFVVLHQITDGFVVVADPASGVVRHSRKAFEAIWSRVVLVFEIEEDGHCRRTRTHPRSL